MSRTLLSLPFLVLVVMAFAGSERLGQVVEAINRQSADTGVTAYLTANGSGQYTVDLMSSKTDTSGAAVTDLTLIGFTTATTGLASAGTVNAAVANLSTGTGIDIMTVATQSDAWVALKKIDDAIDQVNSARADLGALQSRFESAVANIEIQIENLSAARGRIVDADFAKETANLSRTQILQQAGTAMVAQAYQLPQGVLALLRQ